jgi:hypothetical protein
MFDVWKDVFEEGGNKKISYKLPSVGCRETQGLT